MASNGFMAQNGLKSGTNRALMAQNGLKLWENGAGRFGKAMGYLPELWDSIKNQKRPKVLKLKNT